uniref:Branched-chain-amino-acid aminotransferase n=1 Tax=Panagrellus redivivus TaxID=6233 RepID=A0A7E4UPV0_PANRE
MLSRHHVSKLFQVVVRRASTAAATPNVLPDKTEPFYHRDLEIHAASPSQMKPKPDSLDGLKFGHTFSDHMFEVNWDAAKGWTRPIISPLHDFHIHPGAKVLHYAIELFEGMKAYRGVDNKIRLFRPDQNMARMRRTAARSSLPDFDANELTDIIADLVKLDKEWVPYSNTASLYLRPTMISTDPTLGVGDPSQAKLFVLTGPAGAYYPTGFKPISLLADPEYVRAFPGGVGSFKMGCNYAPTILIGKVATSLGCQQALWLYDKDEKLTEVGTMNIFVFWTNEQNELELVTPPLSDGLILPGVTRDSLIQIAKSWNEFKITERYPTMDEIKRATKEKRVHQVFGAGTACIVSPVGRILYKNTTTKQYEEILIPTMDSKIDVMQRLYDTINDIQYGRIEWPGWTKIVA